MCGTLSRSSRDTAIVRSASIAVGAGKPFIPLPSGWNASGMNACMPDVSSCRCAQTQQMVDAVLERFDVPVEHRRVGPDAQQVGHAVHFEPLVAGRLVVGDARTDIRVEDLGATARQAVESRASQTLENLAIGHPVVAREEVDLNRREALQVNVGLDAA